MELYPKRYLYGVYLDEEGGGILLVRRGLIMHLPGGRIMKKSLPNETYRRDFIARTTKNQTGLTHIIKNGERMSIKEAIQPMPATYNVNRGDAEHSAIIVGNTEYGSLRTLSAFFYSLERFMELVQRGQISKEQELLILRAFASRDNPDGAERKRAGKKLRELQANYKGK